MSSHTIFYSWQSDLPNSINRGFIEDCLERAIKELTADEEVSLDPCLDRDTTGVAGSPDIAATIFDKIKRADIFVADVSFIDSPDSSRRCPNPNVLVELGYAAGCLGWERIVCVFNEHFGEIKDLPFDLRPRRIRAYRLDAGEEKAETRKALVRLLKDDTKSILHAPDAAETAALQSIISAVASELVQVIIFGRELEDRHDFDALSYRFAASANTFRQFATDDTAIRHELSTDLDELARLLDEAAHFRLHLGNWQAFAETVGRGVEKALVIKAAQIDGRSLSPDSVAQSRSTIVSNRRQLDGLAARAMDMVNEGRLEDLQSKASAIGFVLLQVGYFNIDVIQPGLGERVRAIGRDLHLVETMRVYHDGGRSMTAVVERVQENAQKLGELVDGLPVKGSASG